MSENDELELLRTKCHALENELEIRRKAENEIRTIRHDIKNHLAAIAYLNKKHETERLAEYLSKLNSRLSCIVNCCFTGNDMIDSALCSRMDAADISVDSEQISLIPEASPADIVSVICSVLDIAVTNSDRISVKVRTAAGLIVTEISWNGGLASPCDELMEKAEYSAERSGIIITGEYSPERSSITLMIP